MASVDPGANIAVWRRVAVIALLVRYMLTPVEATTASTSALLVTQQKRAIVFATLHACL
jgi:hypothetical protein